MANNEQQAMIMIACSGHARTLAFNALKKAREKKYEEAKELLEKSKEVGNEAHRIQTEMLVDEANDKKVELDLLLIHAQDHLMNSLLAQELINEICYLYELKEDRR